MTSPPARWFYGLAHQYATLYTEVLQALGAEVLSIPVKPFSAGRLDEVPGIIEQARHFRPDLAIGLHDASYALLCRAHRAPGQAPANVFVDWLGLPTVMLWDHAPLQFAPLVLGVLPDHPDQSTGGCLSRLRADLSHPLYLHVARDSGHREIVDRLGVLPRERVLVEQAFAHPQFAETPPATRRLAEIAFFGHLRAANADGRPARHHPLLGQMCDQAVEEKLARMDTAVLAGLMRRVDALAAPLRASLHLDPDQSFYWSLLCSEVDVCQTRLRAAVLAGLDRPVAFFGDHGGEAPGGLVRARPERFRFGADLAEAFAGVDIVVDVVNPGFVHGFGTKVMNCFAAGGFMLQDRKQDFIDAFGELGEAVSYSSLGELRAKVDRYLSDANARADVSRELRELIRTRHSLPAVFSRLIDAALALRA